MLRKHYSNTPYGIIHRARARRPDQLLRTARLLPASSFNMSFFEDLAESSDAALSRVFGDGPVREVSVVFCDAIVNQRASAFLTIDLNRLNRCYFFRLT